MKNKLPTVILIAVFLIGLSVLLYPTVSDFINARNQSRAIAGYTKEVADMDNALSLLSIEAARDYNNRLMEKENRYLFDENDYKDYYSQLKVPNSSVIGYLEIPAIDVRLPIYHSTNEAVLQVGIGHLEGSSLPVGGDGSHTVLSGHRALPSATLLSNLDKVGLGDTFSFQIFDEKLTYEVDQILVVEPNDISSLNMEANKDLATLVTCTPYGINSHRLLVRGHRVDTAQEQTLIQASVTGNAIRIDKRKVAPIVAAPFLIFIVAIYGIWHKVYKRKETGL